MNKKITPDFDNLDLGINPFIKNLKIPVNKIVLNGQYKPDSDGVLLPVEQELERDPMCKVYINAEKRLSMIGLPSRTKDLLLWLIYEAECGKDYIWINKKRYMKESGIASINTYKSAIKELHKHSFINPTIEKDVYWINPSFFFNGSRINKFPNNIVRK